MSGGTSAPLQQVRIEPAWPRAQRPAPSLRSGITVGGFISPQTLFLFALQSEAARAQVPRPPLGARLDHDQPRQLQRLLGQPAHLQICVVEPVRGGGRRCRASAAHEPLAAQEFRAQLRRPGGGPTPGARRGARGRRAAGAPEEDLPSSVARDAAASGDGGSGEVSPSARTAARRTWRLASRSAAARSTASASASAASGGRGGPASASGGRGGPASASGGRGEPASAPQASSSPPRAACCRTERPRARQRVMRTTIFA